MWLANHLKYDHGMAEGDMKGKMFRQLKADHELMLMARTPHEHHKVTNEPIYKRGM